MRGPGTPLSPQQWQQQSRPSSQPGTGGGGQFPGHAGMHPGMYHAAGNSFQQNEDTAIFGCRKNVEGHLYTFMGPIQYSFLINGLI